MRSARFALLALMVRRLPDSPSHNLQTSQHRPQYRRQLPRIRGLRWCSTSRGSGWPLAPTTSTRSADRRSTLRSSGGWAHGRNIVLLEPPTTGGDDARLPSLASELVAQGPDLILVQSVPATRALMQATKSIPMVMVGVANPVELGIVARFEGRVATSPVRVSWATNSRASCCTFSRRRLLACGASPCSSIRATKPLLSSSNTCGRTSWPSGCRYRWSKLRAGTFLSAAVRLTPIAGMGPDEVGGHNTRRSCGLATNDAAALFLRPHRPNGYHASRPAGHEKYDLVVTVPRHHVVHSDRRQVCFRKPGVGVGIGIVKIG